MSFSLVRIEKKLCKEYKRIEQDRQLPIVVIWRRQLKYLHEFILNKRAQ